MQNFREFLTGPPLPTKEIHHEKLNKIRALAAFSPDALSSIAYANHEIYLGLVVAGAAGLAYSWPIALGIVALMIIVAISYIQAIPAYPAGGGSYTVAKANLGKFAGLVAASALLIDYVLTAAVSLTAGVAAISSAIPQLWPYRVPLALFFLVLITLANLRGLRESGSLMAVPVYFFILCYMVMIVIGLFQAFTIGPNNFQLPKTAITTPVSIYILLHTFASGCTALTGIEVISNGVPAFKQPQVKNARITMIVMALLMGGLFMGTIGLTQFLGVSPLQNETILSALSRKILGSGVFYLMVQISTLLVLSIAANSSFAGFPRLASVLAQDKYLPNQFAHLGDRLVYTNGIITLSVLTSILIIAFYGDSHSLIPLFAVGVFLAFTLSQAGMVVHWVKSKNSQWVIKSVINGTGAIVTLIALSIIAYSKFLDGAWLVVILIPAMVLGFTRIHDHFLELSRELTLRGRHPPNHTDPRPRLIIPISSVHRGTVNALEYALSITNHVTAVYVEVNPELTAEVREDWKTWGQGVTLVVVQSPFRSLIGPFLDYLFEADQKADDGQLATVLLPEFVPVKWWHHLLHNQTATLIRLALLYNRRKLGTTRAIIDVPFQLKK
jgi:amino acid transporter